MSKKEKALKGYKTLRDDYLDWAKSRYLDSLRAFHNPEETKYMKAFKTLWDADPKCKGIKLEIFETAYVEKGSGMLTGKNEEACKKGPEMIYSPYLPRYMSTSPLATINKKEENNESNIV